MLLNSCTKTGPQGPKGATGATGQNGLDGNANVKGADPFTVSSWALTTVYNTNDAYWASFTDPDVTQSVADHGVVEIFLYYPADGTWRNLPDIVSGTEFYSRFSLGGFDIYYQNLDGSTPAFPGTWTFRSVVISPSNKRSHPNTNWKNYNEAIAALYDNTAASAQ